MRRQWSILLANDRRTSCRDLASAGARLLECPLIRWTR